MAKSITQKLDYGCGVACFAFVCNMNFDEAIKFLGREYSVKNGWRPSDLSKELNSFGFNYKNYYVRKKVHIEYPLNSIVLIEKSQQYCWSLLSLNTERLDGSLDKFAQNERYSQSKVRI
ncbi:hypothetical protein L336_0129 [Candidatus Saccharimonas aalborgensis]|uniref:Peptidase C39 domain-containing protein n=1 Tax=Candidatus Saccharimonas aalborgensis TaxID=1332188 RepID=R4PUL8_9BACT|nr:hypothetical protein [Candidatus Saccharimonas aalborgensis]AGL61840.1 hypothetical protein L336_0129 [Candidatus Saccharimonas aalborgensis]